MKRLAIGILAVVILIAILILNRNDGLDLRLVNRHGTSAGADLAGFDGWESLGLVQGDHEPTLADVADDAGCRAVVGGTSGGDDVITDLKFGGGFGGFGGRFHVSLRWVWRRGIRGQVGDRP